MKQGWEIRTLSEVCTFFNDGNWIESKDQSDSGYRLIQTGNVGIGEFRDKSGKERYISESTFKRLRCTEIFEGDILISRLPDPVGRTCMVPELNHKMITAVDCTIVRLKKDLINEHFFKYYSQSQTYFNRISEKITGTTRDRISRNNLGSIPVPLPPLPEQQRIAAILDEAFASIEKVKAHAEQNLKNTRELFESYLQSVFANKGEGWEIKTLNQISENLDSKRIPITQNVRSKGSVPYYGASGIVDYVKDYLFDEDLLLVSEDGANLLARTYPIAFSITGKSWINNHAHILKFGHIASQKYVEYYLNSIKLDDYVSGMAQPKLNQKMLNSIEIPFPPLPEQQTIIKKLNSLSVEIKRLQAIYQQKLIDLEELKKSILQKAFRGELKVS